MCIQLIVWVVLAVVVGGVIGMVVPVFGAVAFLAILGFGLIKSNSTETQKTTKSSELEKALWLANDAGAIETGPKQSFRIVDSDAYSELPAEVRMTLELSGKQKEKKKQQVW